MRTLKANPKFLWLFCAGLLCSLCHTAKATIEPPPATKPAGHVLIYTDNSPGSILMASITQKVYHESRETVVVTLNEEDFIARLPERSWREVTVATRFTSTTPGYRKALERYVDEGGIAEIHTWKDDEKNPTQEELVDAPSANQVWFHGHTIGGYSQCSEKPEIESPTPGYVLYDFQNVKGRPITALPASKYPPLVAGEHPPFSPEEKRRGKPNRFLPAVDEYLDNVQLCQDRYGGDPSANPPTEEDTEALEQCKHEAAVHLVDRINEEESMREKQKEKQKRDKEKTEEAQSSAQSST